MTLPFPFFGDYWDGIYGGAAAFTYVFLLPLGEEAFFRVFHSNQWKSQIADIVVSVFYGLMCFAGFYMVMDGILGVALLTAGAIASCWLLIEVRNSLNIMYCLMTKIGINLGTALWVFYLYYSVDKRLERRQPGLFYIADMENIFMN